jgi:hypothetical protein
MSSRAEKFEQLHKSLKKHYKFTEDTTERSVLESLLYACCLEDARPDQAEEAFAKLQQTYFDWNEVRVTTTIELSEVLLGLPNPSAAGHRIKRCLQSIFETRYQYDLDDLKKANLTKATEDMQAWQGMTPFVLNYVSQHSLGGHAIPADTAILEALLAADILTTAEVEKKSIPGVERAIPKNKGLEFASLLHQFAVDFSANAKSSIALAVFKDLGVTPKAKVVTPPPAPKTSKKAPAPPEPASKPSPVTAEKPTAKPSLKDAEKESKSPSADKVGKPKGSTSKAEVVKAEPAKPVKLEAPKGDKKSSAIADTVKKSGKADAKLPEVKSKHHKKPEAAKPAAKATAKPAPPTKPVKGKAVEKPPAKKITKIAPTKGKSAPLSKSTPKADKSEASSKKPAKMANNVKMTKKKPK